MPFDYKCVLIIGATSGIGRALALQIHALPSRPHVIVSGRRTERLDELVSMSDGRITSVPLDLLSPAPTLQSWASDLIKSYPQLDYIIFSSGIQRYTNWNDPTSISIDTLRDEFQCNYFGYVSLTTVFLPFLEAKKDGNAAMCYLLSGLAIVPSTHATNYGSSKAALHSLTLALRAMLKAKKMNHLKVVEFFPGLVESELQDHEPIRRNQVAKKWMSLEEFAPKAMAALSSDEEEIAIGMALPWWEQFEKGKKDKVLVQI